MEKVGNVYFVGKVGSIYALEHEIGVTYKHDLRERSVTVVVTKEKLLSDAEYKEVSDNLFEDRDWITDKDAENVGEHSGVIKVVNKDTKDLFYIRTEGYNYARYVGKEVKV